MSKIIVFLCLTVFFIAEPGHSLENYVPIEDGQTKKICEDFLNDVVSENYQKAFDAIKPHFAIPEGDYIKSTRNTTVQLQSAAKGYGRPLGYELIAEKKVSDYLIRYTYIEKFEKHLLRWNFYFYKPDQKWLFDSYTMDAKLGSLYNQ